MAVVSSTVLRVKHYFHVAAQRTLATFALYFTVFLADPKTPHGILTVLARLSRARGGHGVERYIYSQDWRAVQT